MKHKLKVVLISFVKLNDLDVSLTTTKAGDTVDTGVSVTLWRTKDTVGDKKKIILGKSSKENHKLNIYKAHKYVTLKLKST